MRTVYTTRAPFCHLCGQQVTGRYVRYQTGLTVCARCEVTRPRCERCNIPLADTPRDTPRAPSRGKSSRLCAACERSALRCACCAQPIIGVFYTFEEVQPEAGARRFCASCVQQRPPCDLCRAPVPTTAKSLPDGQWRCASCASEMALGQGPVRAIYAEAQAGFERVVGGRLAATPELRVVGRREMSAARRHEGASADDTGADGEGIAGRHVLGYFTRIGAATTIYVEMGLPRALLLGTLAHELGHAWQTERSPDLTDPLLCEGFAEWAAHRVLVAAGHQTLAAHATRREDVYGRGLRHFLQLEQAHGRAAVLRAIERR